ncbi:MAG: hypothetical protein R3C05_24495 [Pirellulaceae bacterium]
MPKRLVQYHANQAVVVNPPPLPMTQNAMDQVYGLPYARSHIRRIANPFPRSR